MSDWVLVTGSSRGIGRAIALELASCGHPVVVHARSEASAAGTVSDIQALGKDARALVFDIADREQCEKVLTKDIEENGAYYGVVCNAGIMKDAAFPALEAEDWNEVINTNLNGFYHVLHPVVLPMIQRRKPGRIVTVSSMSGVVGNRGQVNYSASKGGIIAATKALALELAKRKITVNCVVPGIIETDMVESSTIPLDEVKKMIPMQRIGTPEEVAGIVGFLLSEKASYITRQTFQVNGGML